MFPEKFSQQLTNTDEVIHHTQPSDKLEAQMLEVGEQVIELKGIVTQYKEEYQLSGPPRAPRAPRD